jgi:hypothetical protein
MGDWATNSRGDLCGTLGPPSRGEPNRTMGSSQAPIRNGRIGRLELWRFYEGRMNFCA